MKQPNTITANNQRILKNSIFIYLRLAIVMAIALYTTRVLLNSLGVVDYGIYNVVCGFVMLFGFLNISMSNGIQRFYNYTLGKDGPTHLSSVYSTAIVIQFIIIAIILLFAETIGLWYINNEMVIPHDKLIAANWIYQFSILSLVFTILQGPYNAAVLAYERMNIYAYISIADALLKLLAAIMVSSVANDRLIFYGVLIAGISLFNLLAYYIYCKIRLPHIKFVSNRQRVLFKQMFSFLGWNIFGSFAYVVKGQGTNLVLNNFFGAVVNAANGITTQITYAIQSFATNLVIAFKPQLTQSYAVGDYARTERLLLSMSKLSYLLFCIIGIPLICEIDYILSIWIGDTTPPQTAMFCVLSIIATGIGCLNTPITQVIHATGKMKRYQIVTSTIICSIVPISWIALQMGASAYAVFYITIVVTIINQVACIYTLNTIFPIKLRVYISDVIVKCLIYTCLSFIIAYLIGNSMPASWLRLLLVCIGSLASAIFIPFFVLNNEERELVKPFIRKFIRR